MNHSELKNAVIESATKYVDYLTIHKLDKTHHLLRTAPIIRGSRIYLPLSHNLPNPELAEVSIRGHKCTPEELETVNYDEKTKCLVVRERDFVGRFVDAQVSDVVIETDITFLIRNIRAWAQAHGDSIYLPHMSSVAPQLSSVVSDQQVIAMEGIKSSHLSYVWGVPGAGKTSVVTAKMIQYYIQQGDKVLLTAPTNSALERALTSVLGAFEKSAVETWDALRIGVPSQEFRLQYPDICLDSSRDEEARAMFRRRIAKAKLIAATVDTYAVTLCDCYSFRPDHIFLDEAGYCPVVKMLPLLPTMAKLVLLGDHKQLPPVCPIDTATLRENPDMCMWAQSAVYCESLISAPSMKAFADSYFSAEPPKFETMRRFDLFHTYRFGGKLVDTLRKHVYGEKLSGLENDSPDISVIDANTDMRGGRMSDGEAYAIMRYLRENECSDFVVLTPYKKQVRLLRRLLHLDEEHVMTIHHAQGREWNTVIISIVDTGNMYFTDSSRRDTHGLEILNTALSRAKKKLIIVCNTVFWRSQRNQIITSLISDNDGFAA